MRHVVATTPCARNFWFRLFYFFRDSFVEGIARNSINTAEIQNPGARIYGGLFIKQTTPFELSAKIKIELENGVAKFGSQIN